MRILLCLVLAALPLAAEDPLFLPKNHKPRTTFLPSRDMMQITNASGRGTASGGSCHGLVEAAILYKEYRETHREITGKEAPDLAAVTQEMKAASGEPDAVARRLAEATQTHVYQQTTQYLQTDDSKRTVFENLKTSLDAGKPVRLSLDEFSGGGHMVAVYDYYEGPSGDLIFRIADPNSPEKDDLTVRYDMKKREFARFSNGEALYDVLGVQRPLERQPEKLLNFIEDARQGRMPKSDFVPSPIPVKLDIEQKATASIDPLVGGVLIRFPTAWYTDSVSEEQFHALVVKLRKFAKAGTAGAIVLTIREGSENLELVSLARVAAEKLPTLGTLTRIRGYVLDESGGLSVVGIVEPGRPAVPVEWLTVALRAVWRDGTHPFVSLDPDPANFAAPHKARVGGLPPDCEGSDFVRVLLEADYLMKRISLGLEVPAIEGFKSWFEMLREDAGATAPGMHRDWLSPRASPVADVFTAERGVGRAVIFESGVQVMTEELKRSQEGLTGTGGSNEVADRAAEAFTRSYADLEHAYPGEFHALHAIFDLCKLGALLRSAGVRHASLDQLAALPVRTGLAKASYPGVPPRQVGDLNLFVSGGATTRSRTARGKRVAAPGLTVLLDAAKGLSGTQASAGAVALPAVMEIDPASLKYFNAELHMGAGFDSFLAGDYALSQERLDLALELDPELVVAFLYRGLARFADGRFEDALADIGKAIGEEPRLRALRAVLQACRGEEALALEDAAAAEAAFADDPDVLGWCAQARLYACDFPGSERVATRVLRLKPLDRDALSMRAWLARLHRLGPAAAAARMRVERGAPIAITQARAEAYAALMGFDIAGAAEPLRRAVALCRRHADNPSVKTLRLLEASQLQHVNALLLGANFVERLGDTGTALEYRALAHRVAGELYAAHPDWPSAGFVKCQVPPPPGEEDRRVEALLHAIDLGTKDDPLIAEFNESMGSEHGRTLLLMNSLRDLRIRDEGPGMKILGEFFRSFGDAELSRLAEKALAGGKRPPPEVEKEFLKAMDGFAERNPQDPLGILLTCSLGTVGVMEAEGAGDIPAMVAAAKAVLRKINRNGLPESTINLVAMTQQAVCMTLGQAFVKGIEEDPRFQSLGDDFAAGKRDVAALRKAISEIASDAEGKIDRDLTPFARAFVKATVLQACRVKEESLIARCGESADETQRAELEKWQASLPPEAMPYLEQLASALDFAQFETELRTVTLFADVFGLAASQLSQESPEFARQVSEFRAQVDVRAKKLKFETPPLDWSGWSASPAKPGAPASVPAAGAGSAEKKTPWALIGGGAALAVLAVGAVVFLRRSRAA